MFEVEAHDGVFRCELPEDIGRVFLSKDSKDRQKIRVIQVETEALLEAGNFRISMMPKSLDIRMMHDLTKSIVSCHKSGDGGVTWEGHDLTDEEKLAATAYLSYISHSLQKRFPREKTLQS